MDPLIHYNGRVAEARSVCIGPTLGGLVYGWGVFTTLRIYEGKAFAFDHHWERLVRHAERSRIRLTINESAMRGAIEEVIEANSRREGRLRITVLKGEFGAWRTGARNATRTGTRTGKPDDSEILVFSADESRKQASELAITISPIRLLSGAVLAGVKQTSMLEHLLAFEEARSRGFDEAVMMNERGEIVGATAANIFWVEGDEVYTPSLATGCIEGVTRRLARELAEKWKLHVVEGGFPIKRLLDAREVFLTSTQREISIVRNFDSKEYPLNQARIAGLLSRQFKSLPGGDTIDISRR
jgi:branched-subunit amino acid aminotransferase/4-amino-4-deoxychorismate lyase